MYGQVGLLPYFIDPNFEFIFGDVRDKETIKQASIGIDIIVHLAGIAGDSACVLHEKEAFETNVDATIQLVEACEEKPVIYISCLRGFKLPQEVKVLDESTVVEPKTIYATTKHESEKALLEYGQCVIFRMDTGFGLSPRMRLDLMVNDFVFKAQNQNVLVLYEASYRRFLVHVTDIAEAIVAGLKRFGDFQGDIINLGSSETTFAKQEICLSIKEHLNYNLIISDLTDIMGKEDYSVNFEKAKAYGITPKVSLDRGLRELVMGLNLLKPQLFHSNTPYN